MIAKDFIIELHLASFNVSPIMSGKVYPFLKEIFKQVQKAYSCDLLEFDLEFISICIVFMMSPYRIVT